jgi:GntR family transcriptional regulator
MDITILTSSPEPVYEQIIRQVQQGVAERRLKPGDPLPTVRQLAGDLAINRNTVARAYQVLEDRGVILTAGRRGTFVRDEAAHEVRRAQSGHAERRMRETVAALLDTGLTPNQVAALFRAALSKVKP